MRDIANRDDIELLVNTFYDRVKVDATIGKIFNDIVAVDWDHHLPKMYQFWSSILLGEHSYEGNPMQRHIEIASLTSMGEIEFSEWLILFTNTVDALFAGEKANEAKLRAGNIARLMLHNIELKNVKIVS